MKKTLLLFILPLFLTNVYSQKSPEKELGTWYIFATNTKFSEKFSLQAQTQFRTYELASELQQFKIRIGGTYQISKGISGSFGYAYFKNDPSYLFDAPSSFNEHRIYEVITLKNELSVLKLTHRYMAEQRFLYPESGYLNRNWMRYMLQIDYPLDEHWNLDIYDEIFLNLEHPNFGQNWLGGGLSYKFNKMWKLRAGYFNQHFETISFNRLVVAVSLNLDATKPKD